MRDMYQEFIENKRANHLSPKTIKNYEYSIGRFVDWMGDRELTQQIINKYFAELDYENFETIRTHARGVKVFLRFHGIGFDIPMPSLRRRNLLTQDSDSVDQALDGCTNDRDKALIMLLFDSGLRRGEVANLRWSQVDLETGLVQVPEEGKTGHRIAMIGHRTRRALSRYQNGEPLEGSVFGIGGGGIRHAINRIGANAGIPLTAQSFRRGFASECIRNGMNLVHVQSLMGHANIETTRRYITVKEADLIEAYQDFGPI